MNSPTKLLRKSESVHPALTDVALLDVKGVCAAVSMSASWVHDEVRAKRFPQPLRFGWRCTRWRAIDIRQWLIARAEEAEKDAAHSERLIARATKASAAAKAKRRPVSA